MLQLIKICKLAALDLPNEMGSNYSRWKKNLFYGILVLIEGNRLQLLWKKRLSKSKTHTNKRSNIGKKDL